MNTFARFALLVLAVPWFSLQAQTRELWHIGKFDDSPVEFSATLNGPLTFEIGKSDASKDWPR